MVESTRLFYIRQWEYGEVYYNDIRVELIKEGGKVVGIYTVAIDITQVQNALLKLEELYARLLKHAEA